MSKKVLILHQSGICPVFGGIKTLNMRKKEIIMIDKASIYMTMAYLIAMQSKDRSTRIGSVIVGPDSEVRSTGYNGLPRGCNDDIEERQNRPEKYYWFEHSERNAIYNAVRMGLSTKGCTLYTQGIPCADCARAIIQSGISKVVVHKKWDLESTEKWVISCERSKIMFVESNVDLVEWDGDILKIKTYHNCEVGII